MEMLCVIADVMSTVRMNSICHQPVTASVDIRFQQARDDNVFKMIQFDTEI